MLDRRKKPMYNYHDYYDPMCNTLKKLPATRPSAMVLSKKTFDSSAWAKERAQSLRYEAVWETVPRQNSIVSKNCSRNTSPNVSSWCA
jgi:hypothetical protein